MKKIHILTGNKYYTYKHSQARTGFHVYITLPATEKEFCLPLVKTNLFLHHQFGCLR